MKPTPQISPRQNAPRSFPLTDYSFQAAGDAKSSSSAIFPAKKLRAFRKVSSEFLGAETSRDYIAELLFFILITGIAAWSVVRMLVAVTRLVRNY
jgi:hypothetical protein